MSIIPLPRATTAQQEYIEQLCIDCGISERTRRNAHLSSILNRSVSYLDEILKHEASFVIDKLKAWKEL